MNINNQIFFASINFRELSLEYSKTFIFAKKAKIRENREISARDNLYA